MVADFLAGPTPETQAGPAAEGPKPADGAFDGLRDRDMQPGERILAGHQMAEEMR
jgi:hypothetical protein